ncbi:MAG: hypothetical protein ISS79_10905 [Phycisphaerae bacterium]|nr:hypothetical protein [Phycisphaerae bacterium]
MKSHFATSSSDGTGSAGVSPICPRALIARATGSLFGSVSLIFEARIATVSRSFSQAEQ